MGWLLLIISAAVACILMSAVLHASRSRDRERLKQQLLVSLQNPDTTSIPTQPPQLRAPVPPHLSPALIRGPQWFGTGAKVKLKVAVLGSPLMYLCDGSKGVRNHEPAAIDIALPVSPQAYMPGARELPYWPQYKGLSPGQRRYFLDWLATGRSRVPHELGYTFLFFYNLERRALVDGSDLVSIFVEVLRLRGLYAQASEPISRSFDSYTSSFLWFLVVSDPHSFTLENVRQLCQSMTSWSQDNLAAALSWFAQSNAPLPDWLAYRIAGELPKSQRSVVTRRVGDEFQQLFHKRFAERFGAGIAVGGTQLRRYAYRPASAALPSATVVRVNPLASHAQFNAISELWNQCVEDLRRLSNKVGKEGRGPLTAAAWDAMPAEIRRGVDHPLTNALCKLVEARADQSGRTTVTAGELAEALEVECGGKLSLTQSRKLEAISADIGFGIEPSPQLTGRTYRTDESIVVFLNTSAVEPDPARYRAAACMLTVGMTVAASDGTVGEDEVAVLTQQIRSTLELNDAEIRRLEVLRGLIATKGVSPTAISRLASELTRPQRDALGKLILAVVAADGVVTKEELRAVRRLYGNLGFQRAEIDQAIDSLASPEEPVTVVQAKSPTQAGEAIPAQPGAVAPSIVVEKQGLKLNRDAIAAIMKDTQEVAGILAAAMAGEPSADKPSSPVFVPLRTASVIPGTTNEKTEATAVPAVPYQGDEITKIAAHPTIPARFAAFYELLIARDEWSLPELQALARQQGHMLSGALETLNDWAFDKYGGQLFVEDGQRLLVERSYLN